MTRIFERPVDATITALAILQTGGLEVVSADAAIGFSAGELHARHYDRNSSPLSMADCIALATALVLQEPLATADRTLATAARAEGIAVLPLADSGGRRPTPA